MDNLREKIEKFLSIYELPKEGGFNKNNEYIIMIENSDEWGEFFVLLSTKNLKLVSSSEMNTTSASANFIALDYDLELFLFADFVNDMYSLKILEVKGDN